MSLRSSSVAAAALTAAALSSGASAAILVFTDQFLYGVNTSSYTTSTENFSTYGGSYAAGLNGSAGAVSWSAGAAGGVNVVAGVLASGTASTLTLSFGGGPDVYGISGNFFGSDASSVIVPSFVTVRLNDGTTYLNYLTAPAFVGFVSTGAAISSIEVEARDGVGASATWFYANLDNASFAYVPAPGAIALLGLAGLAGRRRR